LVTLRQPAAGPWRVPPEAARRVNPEPDTAPVRAAGRELYREHCRRCHGDRGRGDGPEAVRGSVRMPDFTDPERMAEQSDGELFYKITVGRRPMPGYRRRLTESQRWQLVRFLRTLAAVPTQPAEPRP
jgi:mono/diheme cytochrome c family protein